MYSNLTPLAFQVNDLWYERRQLYYVPEELLNYTRHSSKTFKFDTPPIPPEALLGCPHHEILCTLPPPVPSILAPLPRCKPNQDSEGCWLPTSTVLSSWTTPTNDHLALVNHLKSRISGDLDAALSWPMLWVPSQCQYHRYNVTHIYQYVLFSLCIQWIFECTWAVFFSNVVF